MEIYQTILAFAARGAPNIKLASQVARWRCTRFAISWLSRARSTSRERPSNATLPNPRSPARFTSSKSELGGDLFRRERPHAQLTELGQRMLPTVASML